MSLPIYNLRVKLQELIKFKKRGYMALLSELSGVPDGTIHRIAFGKQRMVTYEVWKKLHDADPDLPPPPSLQYDADVTGNGGVAHEKKYFIAALQHYYPVDEKFKTAEDLALSVGLTEKDIKGLLMGDSACIPNEQQQRVIAHAFGMSIDEFLEAGRRHHLEKQKVDHVSDIGDDVYGFESATTIHPEIVQIVKMAEKLDDEKIHILKELTLKLLISHLNKK
jgi:hypothetical protein